MSKLMDCNGVSVQVGMVLVLSISIMAIGLVYVGIGPIIDTYVESSHQREVIYVFELMRESIIKIARGVPSRVIEAKMFDGTYFINYTGFVNVNNTTIPIYSVIYKGEEEISLENGAIFRKVGEYSFMVEKPLIIHSNNTSVISVIALNGAGSISGKSIVRIVFTNLGCDYKTITNNTIIIHSDHYLEWKEYLEDEGFEIVDVYNKTVVASTQSNLILLKIVNVKVKLWG